MGVFLKKDSILGVEKGFLTVLSRTGLESELCLFLLGVGMSLVAGVARSAARMALWILIISEA